MVVRRTYMEAKAVRGRGRLSGRGRGIGSIRRVLRVGVGLGRL
jgi:hypothetical protein